MSDVRRCEAHGFFEGAECPVCGAAGEHVLDADRRRRLSKFVSGALRHFPGDAGLDLDDRGWTDADALVAAVRRTYDWADREALAGVLATDPKGRFEVDGPLPDATDRRSPEDADHAPPDGEGTTRDDDAATPEDADPAPPDEAEPDRSTRVRAAYGHSVDVDLEAGDGPVPDELFHGTAPDAVESILAEGIRPMGRQLVHLSGSVADARDVGARHAEDPVVLAVDAAAMQADGLQVTKRGRSVYTTERVPPEYVRVRE